MKGKLRGSSVLDKLFAHKGDEPHSVTCDDGTVITFGIEEPDGTIRRATPEDYPEGVWPPVRIGEIEE